jgi:hypothetical protein
VSQRWRGDENWWRVDLRGAYYPPGASGHLRRGGTGVERLPGTGDFASSQAALPGGCIAYYHIRNAAEGALCSRGLLQHKPDLAQLFVFFQRCARSQKIAEIPSFARSIIARLITLLLELLLSSLM